jgi:endonuclease/exonuclease/phosphatase family metal-dependent hydrolase
MMAIIADIHNKETLVINVHLDNQETERKEQLHKLKKIVEWQNYIQEDANIIVMGDFNESEQHINIGL